LKARLRTSVRKLVEQLAGRDDVRVKVELVVVIEAHELVVEERRVEGAVGARHRIEVEADLELGEILGALEGLFAQSVIAGSGRVVVGEEKDALLGHRERARREHRRAGPQHVGERTGGRRT
jgi:hypothetical protein